MIIKVTDLVPVTLFMANRYINGSMSHMFFPDAKEAGRLYLYRITPMGSKVYPAIIGWVDIDKTIPATKGQMVIVSGLRGKYAINALERDINARGLRYMARILKGSRYKRIKKCIIGDGVVSLTD